MIWRMSLTCQKENCVLCAYCGGEGQHLYFVDIECAVWVVLRGLNRGSVPGVLYADSLWQALFVCLIVKKIREWFTNLHSKQTGKMHNGYYNEGENPALHREVLHMLSRKSCSWIKLEIPGRQSQAVFIYILDLIPFNVGSVPCLTLITTWLAQHANSGIYVSCCSQTSECLPSTLALHLGLWWRLSFSMYHFRSLGEVTRPRDTFRDWDMLKEWSLMCEVSTWNSCSLALKWCTHDLIWFRSI